MAEFATLARPYAEAVFDLAVEANNFDEWSDNLNFLATVIEDPTMAPVIANPQVNKNTLASLLLDVCKEQFSEAANNLLKILVDNNRLLAIPQLAVQYEQLKAQHQGYLNVEIASPYPINTEQQQELETALQKRLGKAVDISMTVDKSLLGGCLIRAGDKVIDASIKGRLQQLAAELRR
jgi:F-type H+-transporting ATPase subunit delta